MINVYICEDNKEQLNNMIQTIEDKILIENYDLNVSVATADPYQLLKSVEEAKASGIYFLDVDLNADINGIQLAEKIRKIDPNGSIVFITTHAELSYLTFKYKVEALDYIIKDDFHKVNSRIRECLVYAHDQLSQTGKNEHVFKVETRDKVTLINLDQIIAFETASKNHKIILHTLNSQVEFYGILKEILTQLDDQFVRCHHAYIINKMHIDEIDKKKRTILMKNGQEIICSVRGMKLLK